MEVILIPELDLARVQRWVDARNRGLLEVTGFRRQTPWVTRPHFLALNPGGGACRYSTPPPSHFKRLLKNVLVSSRLSSASGSSCQVPIATTPPSPVR